jgi:phage tail sheath protein FI
MAGAGPTGTPVTISSSAEFAQTFGSGAGHLADAVKSFFENGGRRAYVLRLLAPPNEAADTEAALAALDGLDDVGTLALPGVTTPAVLDAAARYCARRRHMTLVADCPANASPAEVGLYAQAYASSSWIAVYHPWTKGVGPGISPPSGAVCGVYVRTDATRGTWKAPAGVEAKVHGISGLATMLDEQDLDALVQNHVNPIIPDRSGGFVVWGARTLSDEHDYTYVNVRRFFNFVEASIDRGLDWVVFEPNGEALWQQVRGPIENFLLRQWHAGALQGGKPEEAFFVHCDRRSMTQDDIDSGRLVILIGMALVRPAEFIILRIGKSTADAQA